MLNDFNDECENCWCHECKNNSIVGGNCNNCEKCSADNTERKSKYINDNWKMNCNKYEFG